MSINREKPHILVLPEDDANRQIANGFLFAPNLNARSIQILPVAGGWRKVVKKFKSVHVSKMKTHSKRRCVFLIDFDQKKQLGFKERLGQIKKEIPKELIDRVFVLGVLSEPEALKKATKMNYEKIGEALVEDCPNNTSELWEHELLEHNKPELDRMLEKIKHFLFKDS